MSKIRVGISGATGYTGIELMKILKKHSGVEIVYLTSENQAGKKVEEVEPSMTDFYGYEYISVKDDSVYNNIDAVFLALPHEVSAEITPKYLKKNIKVIDLSASYRIKDIKIFEKFYKFNHPSPDIIEKSVYGLPEIYYEKIKNADIIANPGCYPTSILLPLIPLYSGGFINNNNIIIDSKSGFSGRGRKTDIPGIFYEMNENFYAYNIGNHRHTPEINQELSLAAKKDIKVTFTPHILPIDRGILSTIYIKSEKDISIDILDYLTKFYSNKHFIKIFKNCLPQLKWVAKTNENHIGCSYDKNTNYLIIISTIDNLIKGASGQAVQNFNIMFGFNETEALL